MDENVVTVQVGYPDITFFIHFLIVRMNIFDRWIQFFFIGSWDRELLSEINIGRCQTPKRQFLVHERAVWRICHEIRLRSGVSEGQSGSLLKNQKKKKEKNYSRYTSPTYWADPYNVMRTICMLVNRVLFLQLSLLRNLVLMDEIVGFLRSNSVYSYMQSRNVLVNLMRENN